MGMYGGYFFVFIRAIVCIIWYGIQTFYAGNILSVMLRCIFGSSWENFPNALPASANITSKQLLTFFMAWLMEFPFVSIPISISCLFARPLLTVTDVGSPQEHPLHLHCEGCCYACRCFRCVWLVHEEWRRTRLDEPRVSRSILDDTPGLENHGWHQYYLRLSLAHVGQSA